MPRLARRGGKLQLDPPNPASGDRARILNQSQPKTFVVTAPRKLATAGQASDGATNAAHAWEFTPAIAAAIKIPASKLACGQREFVTDAFSGDAKIAAGAAPLPAVRQNSAAAGPMLRQQMSKLVPQSALDFIDPEFLQRRIQGDETSPRLGPADGGAHSRIPLYPQSRGESVRADLAQERDGGAAQIESGRRYLRAPGFETKLELARR